jgi:multicomponent Na+:H+ antiporter subunit C
MILANYLVAGALFCLGLFTVLSRRDLIKIILGLSLMEASTYLLLVSMAYRRGSTAPVLVNPPKGITPDELANGSAAVGGGTPTVADPVLQNFCLTAIVIGVAVTAVFLTVAVRVAQHYRSVDAADMTSLRG